MIERQELYCHECRHYVQFDLDLSLDGNHVLRCPVCGHEHCRVVERGRITDIRWESRNGPTIAVATFSMTYSIQSTYTASTASTVYTYDLWFQATTAS